MDDRDEPHDDPAPAADAVPRAPETTIDFNGDEALVESIPDPGGAA